MLEEDYFSSRSNKKSNYNFEDELDLESLKKMNLEKDSGNANSNSKIPKMKKKSGQEFGSFQKNGTDNAMLKNRMNSFFKVS